MATTHDNPNPNTAVPTEHALAAAAIVRLRSALDWMIAHPDWEGAIAHAIAQLGYKGQRQGINFRSAALSLPLEAKTETIRHALHSGLQPPTLAQARRLASLWGDPTRRLDAARTHLSPKQWQEFGARLQLRLGARYQDYKRAQQTLFTAHAPLSAQAAAQLTRDPSLRQDLAQEGSCALLEAIDRIDPNKPFAPYARQWIRRRALNFLMRERAIVTAPINLLSHALRSGHEAPSSSPLAALANGLRSKRQSTDADPIEQIPCRAPQPNEDATLADDYERLHAAIHELTPKQRHVLQLRYGLASSPQQRSLAQVAAATGISRQQVHQRETRALGALARSLAATPL